MPRVSREQTDKNRLLIEAASARLFKERGINGVSVADIMASAGLTHGGFYGHFESKDELAAIACAQAFDESTERWRSLTQGGADEQARVDALAKHYLSASQRDDPGFGCTAAGLAVDVGREAGDKPIRGAYTHGIKTMLDIVTSFSAQPAIEESAPTCNRTPVDAGRRADARARRPRRSALRRNPRVGSRVSAYERSVSSRAARPLRSRKFVRLLFADLRLLANDA